MKITRSRLKQIIKEEMAAMAEEVDAESAIVKELSAAGLHAAATAAGPVARALLAAASRRPDIGLEKLKAKVLELAGKRLPGKDIIELLSGIKAKAGGPAGGPEQQLAKLIKSCKDGTSGLDAHGCKTKIKVLRSRIAQAAKAKGTRTATHTLPKGK